MALLIPPTILEVLPAMVRNELSTMDARRQEEFVEEYQRKAKKSVWAYLLMILFGLHYAYYGKWGLLILFWLTAGGFFFWAFVDLFRMPSITRNYNRDVAIDVMRNMQAIKLTN